MYKINMVFPIAFCFLFTVGTSLAQEQGPSQEEMASFKEFPPRNKPATFSVGDALKSLETASQH